MPSAPPVVGISLFNLTNDAALSATTSAIFCDRDDDEDAIEKSIAAPAALSVTNMPKAVMIAIFPLSDFAKRRISDEKWLVSLNGSAQGAEFS